MGIEEFKHGVFKPDAEELEKIKKGETEIQDKFDQANDTLRAERVEEQNKKDIFAKEFNLEQINGFEQLTSDDIDKLMEFVGRKTQLTEDEKEILKNEVIEKAKKIIAEKINKDA